MGGRGAGHGALLASSSRKGMHAMQLEIAQLDRKYATLRIDDRTRRGQLAASLLEHGQQTPVVVVPAGAAERYVLIDGYLRVAALESLCRDLVEALIVSLSEADALVISHRVDGARERTALEQGWLLRELIEAHSLSRTQLAIQLGRSSSWISRRLSLVELLPERVQRAVQMGKLCAHAAMRYLVPLARANARQCETLVEQLGSSTVSVRQMERLYVAWRDGDDEQRERVVRHPALLLQATAPETGHPPPATPTALLLRDFGILTSVAARATRRLEEHAYRDACARERDRLRRSYGVAARQVGALQSFFDEDEGGVAGP